MFLQIITKELPKNMNAIADTVIEVGNSTQALQEKIFSNTFIAGTEVMFSIITATGEAVPVIGPIFTALKNIKDSVDLYGEANEECSRISVWCSAIVSCLGKLAKECHIDEPTSELLTAVHVPLKEFGALIQDRLNLSKGVVGKILAFGTSSGFLAQAAIVQQKVQTAIDALKLQLSTTIQIGVDKVLKRTELLLNLEVKMDLMLDKLDSIDRTLKGIDAKVDNLQDILLQEKRKMSEKEVNQKTRDVMTSNMMIPSSKLTLESTPFARGGTSKVYRATYSKQLVAVKVQTVEGSNTKQIRHTMGQFEKELALLCQLSHPNVLRVWGACTDSPGSLILVMEYAQVIAVIVFDCLKLCLRCSVQNGTLREYLDNSKSLPTTEQIDLVHQLIFGLAYLHNHKVSHGDFKSLNVLLDAGQGYSASDLQTFFIYQDLFQLVLSTS